MTYCVNPLHDAHVRSLALHLPNLCFFFDAKFLVALGSWRMFVNSHVATPHSHSDLRGVRIGEACLPCCETPSNEIDAVVVTMALPRTGHRASRAPSPSSLLRRGWESTRGVVKASGRTMRTETSRRSVRRRQLPTPPLSRSPCNNTSTAEARMVGTKIRRSAILDLTLDRDTACRRTQLARSRERQKRRTARAHCPKFFIKEFQ